MTARLVETGHRDGRSAFVRDDKVQSVDMPGVGLELDDKAEVEFCAGARIRR